MNIRNDDIADGNPKLTLGLIWTIILHFQVAWPPTDPLPPPESPGLAWHLASCAAWELGPSASWHLEPSCQPVPPPCASPVLAPWPEGPGLSPRPAYPVPSGPDWAGPAEPPCRGMHSLLLVWPPAPGKVLEKHPLHGLTHPLPARPHRKLQI